MNIESLRTYQRTHYRSIIAVFTANDHVRYTHGHKAWYRSVLDRGPDLRVSRRAFERAGSADYYARKVRARLEHWRCLNGREF